MKTRTVLIVAASIVVFHVLFALAGFAAGLPETKPAITPKPVFVYRAEVVRVKDGDTIEVNVDLGFSVWLHGEAMRLLRVYAPETFRPKDATEKEAGLKVKAFLLARLTPGEAITIETKKDGRDKYGRYLVEVWDSDGSVNQAILDFMIANNIKPNKE